MKKKSFDKERTWFLGLDVGTNSVGWAATDEEYNILKFKGNATWGIYLFDEAKNAADRRNNRVARRRLQRKKQRIALLRQFFAKAIAEKDPQFYTRLNESQLWSEDRTTGKETCLLIGPEWNDRLYHRTYPTIHHLICELMESKEYHDPRLVYLACSYLLTHRGHFLLEVDENNVENTTAFNGIYEELMSWFDSAEIDRPWNCASKSFEDIMKKRVSSTKKEKLFIEEIFNGKKITGDDDSPISVKAIIAFLSGRKVKLSELYCDETYDQIDNPEISASSSSFEDQFEALSSILKDEEYDLLSRLKRIYDWSLLVDILQGEKNISFAKVKTYEIHRKDVELLKHIVKKYCPEKYSKVFREIGKENNYPRYSYNVKDLGKNAIVPKEFKGKCSQEDFCKFVLSIVKNLDSSIEAEDKKQYGQMIERLEQKAFCPKQVTSDNRVIPYQLYYVELKNILENAKEYLAFLNERDEYGTVKDKILSIMTFRIPYYVGPLNARSEHAWIRKLSKEKIYPWNFDAVVDKDRSETEFIRRMTSSCTYLAGKDVLPKYSLLYSKYTVLNEINNLQVNDTRISVEAKQGIYNDLFLKRRRVSLRMIREYLLANGYIQGEDELKGVDETIKSELRSYHDFKEYIRKGVLSEKQVEEIIYRITLTTDRSRLRKWLREELNLDENAVKSISGLKYSDFGRLSRELLTQIFDLDSSTGELRCEENIISKMWTSNCNLMMLLSNQYGYMDHIASMNEEYYDENPSSIDQRLKDMYVSNAVKRPILRTIEIAKELKKVIGCPPEKVFIEMARGTKENQKGKRTKSRKDQIKELYENYDKNEVAQLIDELESYSDSELRSDRLFLYFCQLGRCMYTGTPINISELGTDRYDIDHIWPQCKIKDDSLDNRVLVLSKYNGKKGDEYPLPEEWRRSQMAFWMHLHKTGLISDKKLERLKRTTTFTDEELASFINRQLVETRQSTKAIATILKELFPKTEIVYVKAGLVSDFRQEFKDDYQTLKCREINDLHHAKDAYLNIVVGNVFHTKFTANPLQYVKSGDIYSLKIRTLLEHDVVRAGRVAWKAENSVWLKRVTDILHKNNIRFVRYSSYQNGCLFKVTPVRRGLAHVPLKKTLSTQKYGGYVEPRNRGFFLVKYADKKKCVITLVAVPIHKANMIKSNEGKIEYCKELGYANPELLLEGRMIKMNSLWEIDGYRVSLACKSNDSVKFKCAQQLVLPVEEELYVKKLGKYCERSKGIKDDLKILDHDGISVSKNLKLYQLLKEKLEKTNYSTLMKVPKDIICNGLEKFESLSIEKQSKALMEMIGLFSCGDTQGADLSLLGGAQTTGVQKMAMKLQRDKFSCIRIIDQSPTGLFEQKTPNLFDL